MGNNVSLITAFPGTTISSSSYNSNLNALNNASSYKFAVGRITAINIFDMAGSGTYNHGLYPYIPKAVAITAAGSGGLGTVYSWTDGKSGGAGGPPTSTTCFLGATAGNRANVIAYAPS